MNTAVHHAIKRIAALVIAMTVLACASPGRQIKLPEIEKYTTKNGMDVYVWPDKRAPIVMQQFWFKVGSADERHRRAGEAYGTTGLSHFFEHLMFRGTKKFPNYFEGMSRMGAQVNAFTWLDETTYWEKLPSRYLDRAIEMEADRIQNLKMDFLNLEPEREVVKSERLMRTDNSPQGLLSERVTNLQYQQSPYQWPTVGWMDDLIAVKIKDAEDYFKKHYLPNNAFAVYVGDVKGEEVLEKLNHHLGDWPRGHAPTPASLDEPLVERERRTALFATVKAPVVEISFLAPEATSRQWAQFEILDAILTRGRSSLLKRSLVFGPNPVATEVSSFLFALRGRAPYTISIQGLPGTTGTEIVKRVQDILDQVRRDGVDDASLVKAVRSLRGKMVRYMKSVYGKAHTIGFWIRATGDPNTPFRHLSEYGSVSSEDVQALAERYLAQNRRTVGTIIDPTWLLGLALSDLKGQELEAMKKLLSVVEKSRRLQRVTQQFALERRAIVLLKERAETARAQYDAANDEESLTALNVFLSDNEKGPAKRQRKLDHAENQVQKSRVQIEAGLRALELELEEAESTPMNDLKRWLLHAARGQASDVPKSLPKTPSTTQALSVAYALKSFGTPAQLNAWIERTSTTWSTLAPPKTKEGATQRDRARALLEQLRALGTPSRVHATNGGAP